MPKSKRNKLVSLTKTKKKGREHKESIISAVRESADKYASMYVFGYDNMRNQKFKELREKLKDSSRFFLGGNKVLQVALGKSDSDEIKEGIHKASELVTGERGLFFTNLSKEEALRTFEEYEEKDFARTGSIASETVEYPAGPLEQFSHDMEPFLRKQGMPTRLNRGVIELVGEHTVCRQGEPISPEASRLLRVFGLQLATFKLHLLACWTPDSFEVFQEVLDKFSKGEGSREEDDNEPVELTSLEGLVGDAIET